MATTLIASIRQATSCFARWSLYISKFCMLIHKAAYSGHEGPSFRLMPEHDSG